MIEQGWEAVGRDGEKLGHVEEVAGDTGTDIFSGLVVRTGLFKGTRFVPAERVAGLVEGRVTLDIGAKEFERLAETQTG